MSAIAMPICVRKRGFKREEQSIPPSSSEVFEGTAHGAGGISGGFGGGAEGWLDLHRFAWGAAFGNAEIPFFFQLRSNGYRG